METPHTMSPVKTCPNAPMKKIATRPRICDMYEGPYDPPPRNMVRGIFVGCSSSVLYDAPLRNIEACVQEYMKNPVMSVIEIPCTDDTVYLHVWHPADTSNDQVNMYMQKWTGYEWRGPAMVFRVNSLTCDPEYIHITDAPHKVYDTLRSWS